MSESSSNSKKTKKTGFLGEQLASRYLQKKGYRLLESNFVIWGGELDLVMEKNGILVFVEVKTRRTKAFGGGEEAMTFQKKQKLLRSVHAYLQKERQTSKNFHRWQLDLIDVYLAGKTAYLKHLPNIFLL